MSTRKNWEEVKEKMTKQKLDIAWLCKQKLGEKLDAWWKAYHKHSGMKPVSQSDWEKKKQAMLACIAPGDKAVQVMNSYAISLKQWIPSSPSNAQKTAISGAIKFLEDSVTYINSSLSAFKGGKA